MPILKDFLQEELKNSQELKKAYEKELKALPKGALVRKKIKDHFYYYLAYRNQGKVEYVYKGKVVKEEIELYLRSKKKRAQLRHLLSEVKKQIQFMEKVLHDRKLQFMP